MTQKLSLKIKQLPLLVLLVMVLLVVMGVTVLAGANDPAVSVGHNADAVVPGATEVTIPVSISNNPGFAGFTLAVNADSALTLTGITGGSAAGDLVPTLSLTANVNQGLVTFATSADIPGDGVLFYLTFSVDAAATNGDKGVTVALKDNSANNFANAAETPVAVTFNAGYITVEATVPSTVWDGTTLTEPSQSSGAYQIATGAELAWFANAVNSGNASATAVLNGDIELGVEHPWTPIGSQTAAFAGSFDGNGHSVDGLYISSSSEYQGLFGKVAAAGQVSSLRVNGQINSTSAGSYIGGVVGYNSGDLLDVIANVTVNAGNAYNVGGIAGFNMGTESQEAGSQGHITRCANLGNVTGYQIVGGIVGENAGTIRYSYNTATVLGNNTSSKNGVGGIAGRAGNNNTATEISTIQYCYNTGSVGSSGQKWVGGIAGFQNSLSAVSNCYVTGTVVAGAGYNNPIVGNQEGGGSNNYSLDTLYSTDSTEAAIGIRKTATELQNTAFPASLGAAFVADNTSLNGGYPVLYWQQGLTMSSITVDSAVANGTISAASSAVTGAIVTVAVTPAAGYHLEEGSLTYQVGSATPVAITATEGVYSFVMPSGNVVLTATFAGEFSGIVPVDGVYTVSDAQGLIWVANQVNTGVNTFAGSTVELSQDIDLNGAAWTPIGGACAYDASTLLPSGNFFAGDFNGNGHLVSNYSITNTVAGQCAFGLFGYVQGGDIKNLQVSGAMTFDVNTALAGGVVGVIVDGDVINCQNSGVITHNMTTAVAANAGIGGVVGVIKSSGSQAVKVENCRNSADCKLIYQSGGVVGMALGDAGLVSVNACCDTAAVTISVSNGYCGGVVGLATGAVTNCYMQGSIVLDNYYTNSYFGGIAGRLGNGNSYYGCSGTGSMANCYTNPYDANANRNDYAFALVAAGGSNATVTDCYYRSNAVAQPATVASFTNVQQMSISDMQTDKILPLLGGYYVRSTGFPSLYWENGLTLSSITVDSAVTNGTISAAAQAASTTTVLVTVTPETGYALSSLTYQVEGSDPVAITATEGVYSFVMPAAAVTLHAVFAEAAEEDFVIEAADFQEGVFSLTEAGSYTVAQDAAGLINIPAGLQVTLTGRGLAQTANSGLSVACGQGVTLTISDLYISAPKADTSLLDFNGAGNTLILAGSNRFENDKVAFYKALIHVVDTTELTIQGDGSLYFYKSGLGAGIGGNGVDGANGETCGTVIINGGKIFGKGNQTGATFGGGQAGNGGNITINGGSVNLYTNARGAALGGGGYSSNFVGLGGTVTVTGGSLNLICDFTGAAIGGGGGQNSAQEQDGGKLYVTGGSVRSIKTANMASKWGLSNTTDLITDVVITATKTTGEVGEPVYLLPVDVSGIAANSEGDAYVAYLDGSQTPFYSGGLQYAFSNSGTVDSWQVSIADKTLYLYVPGGEHSVTVNGVTLAYTFDGTTNTFSLKPHIWDGTADTSWYHASYNVFHLTTPEQLAGLAAISSGIGVDSQGAAIAFDDFTGKTVYLDNDLYLNDHTSVAQDATAREWQPIAWAYYVDQSTCTPFNGILDGQGHTIYNMYQYQTGTYGTNDYKSRGVALIGYTAEGAVIRNLTTTGYCYGNRYVAGIVGKVGTKSSSFSTDVGSGTLVENCASYCTVVSTGTRGSGGVVGAAWNHATVRNCANYGNVAAIGSDGNKPVLGGVVGETEYLAENCVNYGTVTAQGLTYRFNVGGVVGNMQSSSCITRNCYNLGSVTGGTVGGVVGYTAGGAVNLLNCYNLGQVGYYNNGTGAALGGVVGEANANATIQNVYYLSSVAGAAIGKTVPATAVFGAIDGETITKASLLDLVNGVGTSYQDRMFVADSANTNNGYPVLRDLGKDTATVTGLTISVAPTKTAYAAREVFSKAGMVVVASYSDGTAVAVTDYTYPTTPLTMGTTQVTISYGGMTVQQTITVEETTLASIAITTAPAKTFYAAGESFDSTDMVVKATYGTSTVETLSNEDYSVTPAGALAVDDTEVTISYTYNGETKTATIPIVVLAALPEQVEGSYQLSDLNDLRWFVNQVNVQKNLTIKAKLAQDIDASAMEWTSIGGASAALGFAGSFDGAGHVLTISQTGTTNYHGLFAYVNTGGVIENLTVAGSIQGGTYTAGIVAYNSGATIRNCVNKATVSGSNFVGGIVGSLNDATVSGCINLGQVSGTLNNVGGIAGYMNLATAKISQCYNSGAITGASYAVGGIAGIANTAGELIESCYNSGAVSGTYYVGGIVGQNRADLTCCYNSGAITGTGGTSLHMASGGIVGGQNGIAALANLYNSGKVSATYSAAIIGCSNNAAATLSNAYYLSGSAAAAYVDRAPATTTNNIIATDVAEKTDAQLQDLAAVLGEGFKQGGLYPILIWQPNEVVTSPAVVTENTAAATVTSGDLAAGKDVVLNTKAASGAETVTKAQVTIGNSVLAGLTATNSAAIVTDLGQITFDAAALAKIDANAGAENAVLSIAKLTPGQASGAALAVLETGGQFFALSLTANGQEIFSGADAAGHATIVLPYVLSENQNAANLQVSHIKSDGAKLPLEYTYANGKISTVLDSFSGVAVEYQTGIVTGVETGDTVYYLAGNTVTAQVFLTADTAYQAGAWEMKLAYDHSKLTFDSVNSVLPEGVTAGNFTDDNENYYISLSYFKLNGAQQAVWDFAANTKTLLATLKFTVNGDAAAGVTALSLTEGAGYAADGYSTETAFGTSSAQLQVFGLTAELVEYPGAPVGTKLLKLSGTQAQQFYFRFGADQGMFWSEQYQAYVMFTDGELAAALTSVTIADSTAGTNAAIAYTGDVDASGKINMGDVQITYDIFIDNSKIATPVMRLRADVNFDAVARTNFGVDIGDVQKILNTVLRRAGGIGY